jgi:uncharacterized SAM-binding protein YcdF (DUF218 family)
LKPLLLTLAFPPGCFLYLSLLAFAVMQWRRRFGKAMLCIGLAGLTVLAVPVVAEIMMIGLGRNLPVTPPPDALPQAIVILGGDLTRTADPPFVLPGFLTLDRLRTGAALRRRTGLPVLVTGGIVQQDRLPVGDVMATSLREDFQIPVEWVEDTSLDTWQNASFSAKILKEHGIHSVYLVTQAWHLPRAIIAFRHAGIVVTAVPTSVNPPLDPFASDFLPHASAWETSYFALHEWIGYAWYALR